MTKPKEKDHVSSTWSSSMTRCSSRKFAIASRVLKVSSLETSRHLRTDGGTRASSAAPSSAAGQLLRAHFTAPVCVSEAASQPRLLADTRSGQVGLGAHCVVHNAVRACS